MTTSLIAQYNRHQISKSVLIASTVANRDRNFLASLHLKLLQAATLRLSLLFEMATACDEQMTRVNLLRNSEILHIDNVRVLWLIGSYDNLY